MQSAEPENNKKKILINNNLWFNLLIANKAICARVVTEFSEKNCHQKYWLLEGTLM